MGNPVTEAIQKLSDAVGYSDLVDVANAAHEREQKAAAQAAAHPPSSDWTEGMTNPATQEAKPPPEQSRAAEDETAGASAQAKIQTPEAPTYVPPAGGGAGAVALPTGVAYEYPKIGGEAPVNEAMNAMQVGVDAAGRVADVESREQAEIAASRQAAQDRAAELYANLERHRAEDTAALAKRQKLLEDETDRYTADLADTGKFWRNPGNVIAAIFASLSTMGGASAAQASASVDRMVQSDWQQRKEIADTRLGALKSNLEGYRKLAGDKQAGDLLALSESYKMAEYDVERIKNKMGSEKAKVQGEALQSVLRTKRAEAYMAFMQAIYIRQGMTPQTAQLLAQSGSQMLGYAGPGGIPQVGPYATAPAQAASAPAPTGGAAALPKPGAAAASAPPQAGAAAPAPTAQSSVGRPHWEADQNGGAHWVDSDEHYASLIDQEQRDRFPRNRDAAVSTMRLGIDATRWAWRTASNQARKEIGSKKAGVDLLEATTADKYAELMKETRAEAGAIQARLQSQNVERNATSAAQAQRALSQIQQAFTYTDYNGKQRFNKEAADAVLNGNLGTQLAPAMMGKAKALMVAVGAKPPEEAMVHRWRNDLFNGVYSFRKEISGVSVSDAEAADLNQSIQIGATFEKFRGFVGSFAERAGEMVRKTARSANPMATYLSIINTGPNTAALYSSGYSKSAGKAGK
jgi:hypothetical protein